MWWHRLSQLFVNSARTVRPARQQAHRRRGVPLRLEPLEDRLTPSNFTAATVSDLIADINAANLAGGSNTITLTAPTSSPYTLTVVDNATDGATGLPVIAANDNLTIQGNGDTIARSTVSGTPAFRLFDVAAGASLTLANLTLQGGLAFGAGVSAQGGGIYNQGTLDLNGVTVQNNVAQGQNGVSGQAGQAAAGGGIYSSGLLTLEGGTQVPNNQALGGTGGRANKDGGTCSPGGNAFGGGLYVGSGNASLTSATVASNLADGGYGGSFTGAFGECYANGGAGGNGFGAGLYVDSGSVSLTNVTVSSNAAIGGRGGKGGVYYTRTGTYPNYVYYYHAYYSGGVGGNGFGGGLYAAGGGVTLQSDTVTGNATNGGLGGSGISGIPSGSAGLGEGGGLYIAKPAKLYLDAFTLANVLNNTASTSDPEIYGNYSLLA